MDMTRSSSKNGATFLAAIVGYSTPMQVSALCLGGFGVPGSEGFYITDAPGVLSRRILIFSYSRVIRGNSSYPSVNAIGQSVRPNEGRPGEMSWKPRLLATAQSKPGESVRPWVAIAEENAQDAVKLFVSIMNNSRYPIKVRMEAATRLVMIAGATFRGEKLDAHGRPAANLPGKNVARLEQNALREVLRALPAGSVVASKEHVQPGEAVVVLHDGEHSRKPGGHIAAATVGGLVEQSEEAPEVDMQAREELARQVMSKAPESARPREIPPATGPALDMLRSVWKKD
jgi:hypothetical protein